MSAVTTNIFHLNTWASPTLNQAIRPITPTREPMPVMGRQPALVYSFCRSGKDDMPLMLSFFFPYSYA